MFSELITSNAVMRIEKARVRFSRVFLVLILWQMFAPLPSFADSPSEVLDIEPEVPEHGWKFIILHHTATSSGDVASIDTSHRQRTDSAGNRWLGIGYHFLIGNGNGLGDGVSEATFRWREQLAGAHAGVEKYNTLGIGVCLVGNFEQAPPTVAQIQAASRLIRELQTQFNIPDENILRHGDVKGTACPGKQFSLEQLLTANPEQDAPRIRPQPQITSPARQFQNDFISGEKRFRPTSAQTMEGLKHVVTISRLGQLRASHHTDDN